MKTKSALPWFGSDSAVAPQLGLMLADCLHVTIPFAGGMSILPWLQARGIVANDLHREAINFYRFISGRYSEGQRDLLIKKCNQTLSHEDEMDLAMLYLSESADCIADSVNRAWAFWAMCWIGRKGQGGTAKQGGKPSVRRTANGGNNASRLKAAAGDLAAWAEDFRRCEFTCQDWRECIKNVSDTAGCGLYCDPPWIGAGDGYLHKFTEQDHVDLRDALSRFSYTSVVIRYGDCQQVRDLYSGEQWDITEATSRTQANKSIGEIWITNGVKK